MIRSLFMVELTVSDWEASLRWYRDVLGLTLVPPTEPERFALLETGGGRVALKAGTPSPGTVLLTFEVDDLVTMLERLSQAASAKEPLKESAEGYRRIVVRDPDGYHVCLFEWMRES